MTCNANLTMTFVRTIECGDMEQLEFLLDCGYDVNMPMGRDGWPPLCCAVSSSKKNTIETLLKHGADPNRAIERGMAEGMVALDFCRDVSIARMLLQAGARLDLVDKHGRTPGDWASLMGRQDMIRFLSGGPTPYSH